MPVEIAQGIRVSISVIAADYLLVEPGDVRKIALSNHYRIGVTTFCDLENTVGTIWVTGREGYESIVRAILYNNDDEEERGQMVNPLKPIKIIGTQSLLVAVRGRGRGAACFYLNLEDDEDDSDFFWSPRSPRDYSPFRV